MNLNISNNKDKFKTQITGKCDQYGNHVEVTFHKPSILIDSSQDPVMRLENKDVRNKKKVEFLLPR